VIVAVNDLHLRYERLDMAGINLVVRRGEVIGLAGLDGSGQEVLMRALAGLIKPYSGQIRVKGVDLTGSSYQRYLRNGVVFGAAGRLEEGLVAGLTVAEHTALVMDNEKLVDWRKAQQLTQQLIQHYNVRGEPNSLVEQLSGGNQQRVLMALLPENPVLLVLEQPTRGLDVDSSQWIWQQLLERRQHGTAIIFSSPDLDELVTYSDRILVFYAGQVYEVPDVNCVTIDDLGHMIGGEFTIGAMGGS
jgi:simple sugar transport system ATP-binding protein